MKHKIHCSHNRLTISYFEMNGQENLELRGVKAYGKIWGKILCFIGYSTLVVNSAEKVYVNVNSLFKNMFSTWVHSTKLRPVDKIKFINNNQKLVHSLSHLYRTSRKKIVWLTTAELQAIFEVFSKPKHLPTIFKRLKRT